jgi:putative glutamine amidotransferase
MVATKTQPVIGIVPSFDTGVNIPAGGNVHRIYLRHEYTHLLAEVGAVPLILNQNMPLTTITEMCDGIVISGGENINPKHYGAESLPSPRRIEPDERFDWEKSLIEACDDTDTPILGICYGMQRLNVHYGGTLIQDIPLYLPDNVGHDNTEHPITFEHDFLGMKQLGVHAINSRHHQAIDLLAEGFTVCATAPDGIIEAIQGHGHFGMQWHPESDETGAHVYRAFIDGLNKMQ